MSNSDKCLGQYARSQAYMKMIMPSIQLMGVVELVDK